MFPEASGVGWYRQTQPAMNLQKLGHQVRVFPYQSWKELSLESQAAIRDAEVLHTARLKQPWVLDILRDLNPRALLVYDIDDDLLRIPAENIASSWFGPWDREGIKSCLYAADLVTVSTEPLAEMVRQYNPNVAVIYNAVDARVFGAPLEKTDGHVRAGWAGSVTHVEDVKPMVEGLRLACEEVGYEKLRPAFMGMLAAQMKKAFPPEFTYWRNPTAINEYYKGLAELGLDIGLCPVRQNAFNNSKSAVKFYEYSAVGAATIASDFGPYQRTIKDGETGLLVSHNSVKEWKKAILDLYRDREKRMRLAGMAVSWVGGNRIPLEEAKRLEEAVEKSRRTLSPRSQAPNLPSLTIGILSWTPDLERLKSLCSCLTHILGRVRYPNAKVVILEQGSIPEAHNWICAEVTAARELLGLNIEHWTEFENKGVPAINWIFEKYPADFFMKCDDDIVPPVGFDALMMEAYCEIEERGDPIGMLSLDVKWGDDTFGTREHKKVVLKSELLSGGGVVHWLKGNSTAVGMCRLERAEKYRIAGGHPAGIKYGTDQIMADRFDAAGFKNCHFIPLIQRRPGGEAALMPLMHLGATSEERRKFKKAELHKMKQTREAAP